MSIKCKNNQIFFLNITYYHGNNKFPLKLTPVLNVFQKMYYTRNLDFLFLFLTKIEWNRFHNDRTF